MGRLAPARRRAAERVRRAVEATGGVPVLLPPLGQAGAADSVVARLDGLVDQRRRRRRPGRYGAEPHPRTAELAPGPRRLGDGAARRGGRRRAAGARGLPRHAGDGGARRWRRSTSTRPTWSATTTTAPAATSSADRRSPRCPAPGWPACVGEHAGRQLPPPPVGARPPRLRGGRARCRRDAGGDGGPRRPLLRRVQWHPETAADVGLLAGLVRAAAGARCETGGMRIESDVLGAPYTAETIRFRVNKLAGSSCGGSGSLAGRPVALASLGEALGLPCVYVAYPFPAGLGR